MVTRKQQGFTIIEVVLVLAIAGLIFLMVFIALPALQRGQKDTQRKNDLSRVQTAVNSYQANNKGALPSAATTPWGTQDAAGTATGFLNSYLKAGGDTFANPSGKPYTFVQTTNATLSAAEAVVDATSTTATTVRILYMTGAVCNGESVTTGQGARKVAFRLPLEGGGIACVSN